MPLSGRRILVVDDEYLIADDLAALLRGAGAEVIGPAASLPKAMRLASDTQHFDAAVLDINLRGEMSYAAADALLEKGTPLLFLSGYSAASLPERFRNIRQLIKPHASAQLIEALDAIIPEHSGGTVGSGTDISSTCDLASGKTD